MGAKEYCVMVALSFWVGVEEIDLGNIQTGKSTCTYRLTNTGQSPMMIITATFVFTGESVSPFLDIIHILQSIRSRAPRRWFQAGLSEMETFQNKVVCK